MAARVGNRLQIAELLQLGQRHAHLVNALNGKARNPRAGYRLAFGIHDDAPQLRCGLEYDSEGRQEISDRHIEVLSGES